MTLANEWAAARAALTAGDLAGVERVCRQVLVVGPGEAWAHYMLGLAAYRRALHADAVRHVERAVEIDPLNAEYQFALGELRRGQGKPTEAIACFERAVQSNPGFGLARRSLAIA